MRGSTRMGLRHGRVLEMSETLREVPSDFRQTRPIGRLPYLSKSEPTFRQPQTNLH